MKKTLVDLLIERRIKEEKYFKDYLNYVRKIKKIATKLLGKVRVLVFGSVIKGQAEPGSDIDVLIISPKLKDSKKKSEIRAQIFKKGFGSPFEIHLVTPEEYQNWYRYFIKEDQIEIK